MTSEITGITEKGDGKIDPVELNRKLQIAVGGANVAQRWRAFAFAFEITLFHIYR